MAMNGTDVLLRVDGVIVGSQRGVTFAENSAEIDTSSKESRAMRVLPGRYDATVSLEALYVPTDTAYLALQTANRNGDFVTIIRQEEGATLESASAIVTGMEGDFPDQEAGTIAVELRVDGEWTAGS